MTDDPQGAARHYPEIVLFPDDEEARMEFVAIPPGTFWMGSRGYFPQEEPRHFVKIPAPRGEDDEEVLELPAFWMAKTPVTQAQFGRWTSTDAYREWFEANIDRFEVLDRGPHKDFFGPGPQLPAENLTWDEAVAYCEWLEEQAGGHLRLPQPKSSHTSWCAIPRLPTELQWECACRAGSETEYTSGDGVGALQSVGWFDGNSGGSVHPVARKDPNAFGLFDMHGNVWEWCSDAMDEAAYRRRWGGEEVGELESERASALRVVRGGSWFDAARRCRSAYRDRGCTGARDIVHGLRVALLPQPVFQQGDPVPAPRHDHLPPPYV